MLSRTARKKLVSNLFPNEEVSVAVQGRQAQAAVLTNRRVILVAGGGAGQIALHGFMNYTSSGEKSIELGKITSISSSFTGLSIESGGEPSVIPLWPSKSCQQAAQEFVRQVHTRQAAMEHRQGVGVTESVADQLTKLAALREKGILTEEEFQSQKSALM